MLALHAGFKILHLDCRSVHVEKVLCHPTVANKRFLLNTDGKTTAQGGSLAFKLIDHYLG